MANNTPRLYFVRDKKRAPFIPESYDNVAAVAAQNRMRTHRKVEDKLDEMELNRLFVC